LVLGQLAQYNEYIDRSCGSLLHALASFASNRDDALWWNGCPERDSGSFSVFDWRAAGTIITSREETRCSDPALVDTPMWSPVKTGLAFKHPVEWRLRLHGK
jgi:hypothetical protein